MRQDQRAWYSAKSIYACSLQWGHPALGFKPIWAPAGPRRPYFPLLPCPDALFPSLPPFSADCDRIESILLPRSFKPLRFTNALWTLVYVLSLNTFVTSYAAAVLTRSILLDLVIV